MCRRRIRLSRRCQPYLRTIDAHRQATAVAVAADLVRDEPAIALDSDTSVGRGGYGNNPPEIRVRAKRRNLELSYLHRDVRRLLEILQWRLSAYYQFRIAPERVRHFGRRWSGFMARSTLHKHSRIAGPVAGRKIFGSGTVGEAPRGPGAHLELCARRRPAPPRDSRSIV